MSLGDNRDMDQIAWIHRLKNNMYLKMAGGKWLFLYYDFITIGGTRITPPTPLEAKCFLVCVIILSINSALLNILDEQNRALQ